MYKTIYNWAISVISRRTNKLANIFLYKRNISVIRHGERVFIKNDQQSQLFIQEVLIPDKIFKQYTVADNEKNVFKRFFIEEHKPKNKAITEVWYSNDFEFEFVSSKYWNHLQFSIKLIEDYDLPLFLDALFVYSIKNISSFKFLTDEGIE
jgi:hypothetical protein